MSQNGDPLKYDGIVETSRLWPFIEMGQTNVTNGFKCDKKSLEQYKQFNQLDSRAKNHLQISYYTKNIL